MRLLLNALTVLICITPLAARAQTVPAATKPPHRQVQTVCPQCVTEAKNVNQAYDRPSTASERLGVSGGL